MEYTETVKEIIRETLPAMMESMTALHHVLIMTW
jgi:hypothetical protein